MFTVHSLFLEGVFPPFLLLLPKTTAKNSTVSTVHSYFSEGYLLSFVLLSRQQLPKCSQFTVFFRKGYLLRLFQSQRIVDQIYHYPNLSFGPQMSFGHPEMNYDSLKRVMGTSKRWLRSVARSTSQQLRAAGSDSGIPLEGRCAPLHLPSHRNKQNPKGKDR